jgi:hypothetical protein
MAEDIQIPSSCAAAQAHLDLETTNRLSPKMLAGSQRRRLLCVNSRRPPLSTGLPSPSSRRVAMVCITAFIQTATTWPPLAYETEHDKMCTDNVTSQAA